MFGLRWRFLWPIVLISLCLVALCAFTAMSLFHQQASMAEMLRDNVKGRRAATELEECVRDLVVLLKDRVESVSALHLRALIHLKTIRQSSDQPVEHELSDRLDRQFTEYLERWKALPDPESPDHQQALKDLTTLLESELLKTCQEFELYNGRQIENSTQNHEQMLRQLAWGMAGVSGLGGVAGLVLGFGVARSLKQTIQRLQVQIRDAAGKLSPELTEIVVTGQGAFSGLHEQIRLLTNEIEHVVQELQQREGEILRAEQLAAVGQLAAGVAHEIRNPLTSIKMLVQTGIEERDQGGLSSDDLRVIEQEVRRMERSLQTFLDFARPPKLEQRSVDLLAVLGKVIDLIRGRADKQRVAIEVRKPPGQLVLKADGVQLQQVFVNLILNALDEMPTGGVLTVTAKPIEDRVEASVEDTGPGISPAMLSKLFQPFASTKDTGLGLGLVISRRIVEDHGGTIEGHNRPDGGACFTVALPSGSGT